MPAETAQRYWEIGDRRLVLGERSYLVGILNVTPDSFSDGGRFAQAGEAAAQAAALLAAGAAIIDVGGESTRPGFAPVSAAEEASRVVPALRKIVESNPGALLSVDTSKTEVARAALAAGARIVNDIWGFQSDPELAAATVAAGASAILMRNGRDGEHEGPILDRVRRSWDRSLAIADQAGLDPRRIALDPGIGFGTTREEDRAILAGLSRLTEHGFPVLLGTSRKRVTAGPLNLPVELRLETTLATMAAGIAAGVALFRVHDVAEHARFASMADQIWRKAEQDE